MPAPGLPPDVASFSVAFWKLATSRRFWGVAQRPTVRWNEGSQRWMAWVRFPDGSRRKVERVDKSAALRDLDELLTLRAESWHHRPGDSDWRPFQK